MPEVIPDPNLKPPLEGDESAAERTGIHNAHMAERAKHEPGQPESPDIEYIISAKKAGKHVTDETAQLELFEEQPIEEKPGLRPDERKPESVADPNPERTTRKTRPASPSGNKKDKKGRKLTPRQQVTANADNGPWGLR